MNFRIRVAVSIIIDIQFIMVKMLALLHDQFIAAIIYVPQLDELEHYR